MSNSHLPIKIMSELRKTSILLRRATPRFDEDGTIVTGLNVGGQGKILGILIENPGISQKALAKLCHIRPQSISETISKLETSGLIIRKSNEIDKRVMNVFLTEMGKQEATVIKELSKKRMAIAFKDLTKEEQETLLNLLLKLNDSIEKNVDISDDPYQERHLHNNPHHPFCPYSPFKEIIDKEN